MFDVAAAAPHDSENESACFHTLYCVLGGFHICSARRLIIGCFRVTCCNAELCTDYSDCAQKTAAPQALDDEAAKKLWDLSASMVGLA